MCGGVAYNDDFSHKMDFARFAKRELSIGRAEAKPLRKYSRPAQLEVPDLHNGSKLSVRSKLPESLFPNPPVRHQPILKLVKGLAVVWIYDVG
ncbi:hypothetical protein GCM10007390_49840 [Persicitalea jodogahamensis]|uniref:Uncharacterized protein n=1 Tax=Persicitalea jodogahamensis TaxID=402147 RepID=A0A8J3GB53_9BACT|nr:hypothetical protein GCM10007390_49840 [Persicitalea jodogahamensis]